MVDWIQPWKDHQAQSPGMVQPKSPIVTTAWTVHIKVPNSKIICNLKISSYQITCRVQEVSLPTHSRIQKRRRRGSSYRSSQLILFLKSNPKSRRPVNRPRSKTKAGTPLRSCQTVTWAKSVPPQDDKTKSVPPSIMLDNDMTKRRTTFQMTRQKIYHPLIMPDDNMIKGVPPQENNKAKAENFFGGLQGFSNRPIDFKNPCILVNRILL